MMEDFNLAGDWYNIKNGNKITIKDSVFDGNDMIIITNDGRQISYNDLSDYVKSDKPIGPFVQQIPQINRLEELDNTLTKGLTDGLTTDNDDLLFKNKQVSKTASESDLIISKALSKSPKPNIKVDFKWVGFPKKELSMLIDVMDIDIKDIEEFCYNEFFSDSSFKETIKNQIHEYLNKSLKKK